MGSILFQTLSGLSYSLGSRSSRKCSIELSNRTDREKSPGVDSESRTRNPPLGILKGDIHDSYIEVSKVKTPSTPTSVFSLLIRYECATQVYPYVHTLVVITYSRRLAGSVGHGTSCSERVHLIWPSYEA